MMEWEKEIGLQMGEEGHGCHGMLVRKLKLSWWQYGKARVVGGSHMTQHQALAEDATNPLLTTDLPDGGMEKKGGHEDETESQLQVHASVKNARDVGLVWFTVLRTGEAG